MPLIMDMVSSRDTDMPVLSFVYFRGLPLVSFGAVLASLHQHIGNHFVEFVEFGFQLCSIGFQTLVELLKFGEATAVYGNRNCRGVINRNA